MKIAFFIAAAVMLAVALALVLLPLVRQGRRSGRSGSIFALVLVIAFVLPISAGGLYLLIGTPAALSGVSRSAPPMSMEQAISELRAHLAKQPDDAKGWMLLAQTGTLQHDPKAARDAYDHVLKLDANNAEAMIGWAESDSMLSDQHLIDGRALALLKRAVLLHPDSQRGLWLLGIGDYQHGDYADAAATWRLLQPQLEPGSTVAQAVAEQIVKADARVGDTSALAAATSTAASLEVDVTLSPSLRSKLAAGDTLFVYARASTGSPMPLAVTRLDAARLPVKVTLDDAMAMNPSMKLSSAKRVFVGARISHAGQPVAQTGDLEGDTGVVPVDSKSPIKITIDKVH
ncbi:MAG: hypothetical protein ABI767_12185 [Rhodanobacter sp.]